MTFCNTIGMAFAERKSEAQFIVYVIVLMIKVTSIANLFLAGLYNVHVRLCDRIGMPFAERKSEEHFYPPSET